MKSIVTSKGQVTIPAWIRKKTNIGPGSELDFQYKDDHTLIVHLISHDIADLKGIVKFKMKKPVSVKEMKNAIRKKFEKI